MELRVLWRGVVSESEPHAAAGGGGGGGGVRIARAARVVIQPFSASNATLRFGDGEVTVALDYKSDCVDRRDSVRSRVDVASILPQIP